MDTDYEVTGTAEFSGQGGVIVVLQDVIVTPAFDRGLASIRVYGGTSNNTDPSADPKLLLWPNAPAHMQIIYRDAQHRKLSRWDKYYFAIVKLKKDDGTEECHLLLFDPEGPPTVTGTPYACD